MASNLLKIRLPLINCFSRFIHTSNASASQRNVAVVLSGCGVYDGSEVFEATSCAIHLTRHNANVHFFAPNINQLHVINHLNGQPQLETRNVLQEAARIARGNIKSLDKLVAVDFDAVVFPGGFGAAKNLSNYATQGVNMNVNEEVERVLKEFVSSKKPIGLCCIAPVLAAKVIPGSELTVGKNDKTSGKWPYADTTNDIVSLGAKSVEKDVNEVHVDRNLLIVTTPAFMKEAKFHEVYDGIGLMISNIVKLME